MIIFWKKDLLHQHFFFSGTVTHTYAHAYTQTKPVESPDVNIFGGLNLKYELIKNVNRWWHINGKIPNWFYYNLKCLSTAHSSFKTTTGVVRVKEIFEEVWFFSQNLYVKIAGGKNYSPPNNLQWHPMERKLEQHLKKWK